MRTTNMYMYVCVSTCADIARYLIRNVAATQAETLGEAPAAIRDHVPIHQRTSVP